MPPPKMSERLNALLSALPDGSPLRLNIMLRSDLEPERIAPVVALIGENAESGHRPHLLPRSKMVHAVVPVAKVRGLADRDEVFWVDTDTEAPLEALLDGVKAR